MHIRVLLVPSGEEMRGLQRSFQGSGHRLANLALRRSLLEGVPVCRPEPEIGYEQEGALFGFFNNGFRFSESPFYGMFALGAMLSPAHFPIACPREQQRISPPQARMGSFKAAFAGDAINPISALIASSDYIEWLRLTLA